MKKTTRTFLMTAAIAFLLGLVFIAIGTGLGGYTYAKEYAGEHGIDFSDGISLRFADFDLDWGNGPEFDSRYEIYSGHADGAFSKEETAMVTKLNVDAGGADFYIHESTDGCISYSIETKSKSQCFIDSNELNVKLKSGVINLYLPKDLIFDLADIDLGAAKANLDFLYAKTMDLDFGASDVTIETISADNVDFDFGAGNFSILNGNIKNAKISVGAGNLTYKGDFTENLKLECGMGSSKLFLTSKESDHSYDLECGMGNIDYGENSYSGVAKEVKSETTMSSHYKIDCGMGNISVHFEQ